MKKCILLVVYCILFGLACNEKTNQPNHPFTVNVDSLNQIFLAGWNKKDSTAIMQTIANDAIVMNDSLVHKGRETIAGNWVSGGVKVLGNIQTKSLVQGSNGEIAYDGGSYSLNLTIPAGPVLKEKGNYSMVWNRQPDGQWQLVLIHIEDITRMPDIK